LATGQRWLGLDHRSGQRPSSGVQGFSLGPVQPRLKPYLGDEDNHVANGLLLRADLHMLFDRGLLGIDPVTLEVHLAPTVQRDPGYSGLKGVTLTLAHEVSRPARQERWNWYGQQLEN
jgi:hypothetical protein